NNSAAIRQVLKFAAQKNLNVLSNHYLHDLTIVNGALCYLRIKTRTDLIKDFYTVIIRRNSDLKQSLPPNM
ncbi:hypothetical protein QBC46DRAFT_269946, partial [Diplogelasinospora grovesii]